MSEQVPAEVPEPQQPPPPAQPRPSAWPAADSGSGDSWHRLHPLSPFVRAGRQLMSLVVVLLAISVLNQRQAGGDLDGDVAVIGIALVGGFISWLVTRWRLTDDVLQVESGLIRRNSQRFPLSQIQAVDVVQSGLARALGLAELQLRMAGGGSARGGRLACLQLADAEQLRRELLALAAPGGAAGPAAAVEGQPGMAAAAGAPERQLFRVRSARLPAAVVLSRAGAIALATAIATALTVWLSGRASTITPFLPVILGVVVALWRQFNGEYGTTVVAAGDGGLRLRSGLVQTAAETIRPGRIQAVRLIEPPVWRLFGWCRLEVDVAGRRQRREDRSEGQRLRALIPVGSRTEAEAMLSELLAGRPAPWQRAPRRARWKAPLSYHFLAWNGDDRYVVAVRGRVCRETTWVPLEKVQSIRWVQGPLQRRFGLASVHLDVAGRRVTLGILDRSAAEAREILGRLPDLAREARRSGR